MEEPSVCATWETVHSAVALKCQPTEDNWFPPCLLALVGTAKSSAHHPYKAPPWVQHPFRPPQCPHCTMGRTALPGSPNQEPVFINSTLWAFFFFFFFEIFSLNNIHRALSSESSAISQGKWNSEDTGQKSISKGNVQLRHYITDD